MQAEKSKSILKFVPVAYLRRRRVQKDRRWSCVVPFQRSPSRSTAMKTNESNAPPSSDNSRADTEPGRYLSVHPFPWNCATGIDPMPLAPRPSTNRLGTQCNADRRRHRQTVPHPMSAHHVLIFTKAIVVGTATRAAPYHPTG